MSLRDHFRSSSWEGLHGQWPASIVHQLNKILPAGYQATPRVHLGSLFEIDIAAFETDRPFAVEQPRGEEGGVAAVWAPAKPGTDVEVELPDPGEYEVRIYDATEGRQLVAAIEIVSPGNKDRPEHRSQFVTKCAAFLKLGVAVSIVDIVTVRQFNLHAELLAYLGRREMKLGDVAPALYASSCRWVKTGKRMRLQTWFHEMSIGQPLPTLPLWLSKELAIPLDLEASYEQACRDLRIA